MATYSPATTLHAFLQHNTSLFLWLLTQSLSRKNVLSGLSMSSVLQKVPGFKVPWRKSRIDVMQINSAITEFGLQFHSDVGCVLISES